MAWWLNVDHGVHIIPAAVLAIAIGAAAGALLDKVLWERLRSRGMSLLAMMIVSIGLSLAARSVFQLLFGGVFRPYRAATARTGSTSGRSPRRPRTCG